MITGKGVTINHWVSFFLRGKRRRIRGTIGNHRPRSKCHSHSFLFSLLVSPPCRCYSHLNAHTHLAKLLRTKIPFFLEGRWEGKKNQLETVAWVWWCASGHQTSGKMPKIHAQYNNKKRWRIQSVNKKWLRLKEKEKKLNKNRQPTSPTRSIRSFPPTFFFLIIHHKNSWCKRKTTCSSLLGFEPFKK